MTEFEDRRRVEQAIVELERVHKAQIAEIESLRVQLEKLLDIEGTHTQLLEKLYDKLTDIGRGLGVR